MPAPSWEDLDVFFDLDEFAVQAVITLGNGSTRDVVGIFDDPYLHAMLGGYDRDQVKPTLTMKETDSVGIKRGCYATILGKQYDVLTSPKGDGTGITVLELDRPQ